MKRLVACLLLVGCGGDNGSIALDDLGEAIGISSCAKQWDCCSDAELMAQYMDITIGGQPITTEDQCVSFTNGIFTAFAVTDYKESQTAGRIEYDGVAAADCLAALDERTCAEYASATPSDITGACRPFIIPKVADGGGCTQDYECTSDNCVGATVDPDGVDTDGSCMPMPTQGQPCDGECVNGNYCGYDQTAGEDICQATKADGAECVLDRECASDECDTTCVARALTCDGR